MPRCRLRAAVLAVLLFSGAVAQAADDPFTFSPPKGWCPERIPFPFGFAPEMKYRGFEELRFGPGMFKPGSETYWTYAFFWWVEGRQDVDEKTLKRDLERYYKGLSGAVGGSRNLRLDLTKVTARVMAADSKNANGSGIHQVRYTADLKTYDAFATGRLLDLRAEICVHHFPGPDRTWVWFSVAPKSADAAVWKTMRSMRDSFRIRPTAKE